MLALQFTQYMNIIIPQLICILHYQQDICIRVIAYYQSITTSFQMVLFQRVVFHPTTTFPQIKYYQLFTTLSLFSEKMIKQTTVLHSSSSYEEEFSLSYFSKTVAIQNIHPRRCLPDHYNVNLQVKDQTLSILHILIICTCLLPPCMCLQQQHLITTLSGYQTLYWLDNNEKKKRSKQSYKIYTQFFLCKLQTYGYD